MNTALIIISLLAFLNLNPIYGQTKGEVIFERLSTLKVNAATSDSIYSNATNTGDYFEIKIANPSDDSLYLFDGYLSDADFGHIVHSKYLHRIDAGLKEYKISFVPLIPYVSIEHSDRIVFGEDRVIRNGQVLYTFKTIPPRSVLKFKIKRSVLQSNEFVSDFDANKLSMMDRPAFEVIRNPDLKGFRTMLEFALYRNISLLTDKKSFYYDKEEFIRQAQSFFDMVIPLTVTRKGGR